MNIRAVFARLLKPHTVSASLERAEPYQTTSGAVSGPVTLADPPQKPDGLALLSQREMWARLGEKARQNRQSRRASICEAHCRDAVTAILRRGPDATTE